ncbi:MAG: phosphate ABC transporter permease subunit PstC [Prevotella sp.]|jgi:phosphate transport system permease protein|nr:phosphate ABC transporter permease subunit PstC [Prevotella sp.]MCH4182078.1 phosphate ABC transporter permease subunit PstC [Prevotella sp.]MCH4212388.1 phosphate ABC transporter permease subunit PstC [Prevotella sp.]MCH4241443.1 phosphate ABC transporter permease subunit PstC [Prevotella sp.]
MQINSDKVLKRVLFASSIVILLIGGGILVSLIKGSMPSISEFGWKFLVSSKWDPTQGSESYGALAFIVGTLMTSVLALIIAIPLAFFTSLFIAEYFKGTKIAAVVGTLVDLLAGIPSIIYGLWGFYILCPLVVKLGLSPQGFGVFTSSLILAIMIVPYATSLSNTTIAMVPNELKEAAYSLGATRLEVIKTVVLPNARSGIAASYVLALGRALGETLAVTMLIGNANIIPTSIFGTGNTMASVIANQFGEASGLQLSALIEIGLLLFALTTIVNAIGKYIIKKIG